MDKKQFKAFCKKEFIKKGFQQKKNTFYRSGKDVLCGIELQKSSFGNVYYINFYYFIGDYQNKSELPTHYDSDIHSRIVVMSKAQTYQGETFLTAQIEYEEYTEDALRVFFEKEFAERILPPIYQGKRFILENLGTLYHLTLNKEKVIQKLEA